MTDYWCIYASLVLWTKINRIDIYNIYIYCTFILNQCTCNVIFICNDFSSCHLTYSVEKQKLIKDANNIKSRLFLRDWTGLDQCQQHTNICTCIYTYYIHSKQLLSSLWGQKLDKSLPSKIGSQGLRHDNASLGSL